MIPADTHMAITWGGMRWHIVDDSGLLCGLSPIKRAGRDYWQEAQYHDLRKAPIKDVCKRCEKLAAS